MTRGATPRSGLLRVSVVSGVRRVDLALPGMVPVAELVPELARSVGVLDPAAAHGGYRVTLADGHGLRSDAGLAHQGVEDGALLTVTAASASADEAARRDDDPVETMADVVETELATWGPGAARWTGLGGAAVLMVLSAVALLVEGAPGHAGGSAAGVALVL
ncbi:EsaB/YukD family protein, partial [Nocardioides sp.]|uniref:EsaB/YukD family protein n=1 Tax=Nocardioides sp. TaxID=35761 RepID=UPI002ED7B430